MFQTLVSKARLKHESLQVFHDVVLLFNPKSLLFVDLRALSQSVMLSFSIIQPLSQFSPPLTREKENSILSGPQVHLFWSCVQLCSLLSHRIGAESVLLPLTISAFFPPDAVLGFIPPQQYSLCPAFTLFPQHHKVVLGNSVVSFTTLLHLKYSRPFVYIVIRKP